MHEPHDEDDYLLKVLHELRRWTDDNSRCNATFGLSTDFRASTLEELTRRILLEKGLKAEIAQLRLDSQAYETTTRLDESLQTSQREEISKLKTECESQLREVKALTEERDAQLKEVKALTEERDAQLKEVKALTEERDAQLKEFQALVTERDIVLQREQGGLRIIQELRAAQVDLRAQITRLSEDTARQEQRLQELDGTNRQLLKDMESLNSQSQASPRVDNPVCTRCLEAEKAVPSKHEHVTSLDTKFDGSHKWNHEVVTVSSSEDENPLNKAVHCKAPRRSHRPRRDYIVSSDKEKPDKESETSRCLPEGLPLLEPRTLPLSRAADLAKAKASELIPRDLRTIPKRETTTIFNRHFLQHHLGGGLIALQVRIATGKQKSLAKQFGITSFMCPNLDHNPWAPSSPGRDGYMFVGLGNEKGVFAIQETHELFVQFAPKKMFYAGRYNFQKVEDLTIDEWQGLDSKVKHRYCETTISKTKGQESVDAVLAAYHKGRLRAPCVLLRFIEYNLPLYTGLSVAPLPPQTPTASNTLPEKLHRGKKRKPSGCGGESATIPKRFKRWSDRDYSGSDIETLSTSGLGWDYLDSDEETSPCMVG